MPVRYTSITQTVINCTNLGTAAVNSGQIYNKYISNKASGTDASRNFKKATLNKRPT